MTGPLPEQTLVHIYRETIRPLYACVSRRVGGDRCLAEDLVQETWMRALNAWPSRGIPAEPIAWLLRVARNLLATHFRRVRPEARTVGDLDLDTLTAASDSLETASIVNWGLVRLRRTHAEVLEAFYFEGKTIREMAHDRRTSERAIEGRLRRARARLKKKLKKVLRPAASRSRAAGQGTRNVEHTRTAG